MDPKAQGKELADKGAGTLPLCEKGREESAWTQGGWNVDLMVGEMKHFSSCHFYFLNEIKQGGQLKLKGNRCKDMRRKEEM